MRFPFTSEEMIFETALPVEEVVRRLRERTISRYALFRSRAEYPVAGSVRVDSCVLFARPPMFVHNSFTRVLALRFEQNASGTVLRGAFRLERFAAIFMIVWFGGLALFLCAFLAQGVSSKEARHS
jgi:hypothetical protein